MNIYRWIQHHVRLVVLIVGSLCILGGYLSTRLPVAIFPTLQIPRIIIAAEGTDAPAQTILIGVTKPIEEAVSTVPGLLLVQSQTVRGSAGFTLTFADGTDMDTTLQLVNSRVSQLQTSFPPGITVTAEKLNPTVFPILDYSLTSDTKSLAELKQLAITTIRPRIARVPGVARVLVNGGDVAEMQVTIRPEELASHQISLSQVEEAIGKSNAVSAVGSYENQYIQHLVLVSGLLTDADSIKKIVVDVKNRIPVTVGDVATVSEGVERRTVIATGGGKEAVLLNIIRQPDGNTVEVAQGVDQELASLKKQLGAGITITPFYDQSEIVTESEGSVVEAIAVGGLLALIVVAMFLRNSRSAFVTMAMLPLTLLLVFVALGLMKMSLNIMTLGAIAIALGLVLDDGIVVVEHIFAQLEEGHSKHHAVMHGLREILPAMFTSSAASIAAFLPLTLLPGVTGDFFAPLAKTLAVTLLISLVLSVTVVPLLAGWVFPRHLLKASKEQHKEKFTDRVYGKLINFCLKRRGLVMLALLPAILISYFVFQKLETGFMPEFDEGAFVLDYRMPPGTTLQETDRVLKQMETVLGTTEGVQTWSRLTGALSGSGLEITDQNQGDILIRLKKGKRPAMDEVMADVRKQFQQTVPNADIDLVPILGDLIGDLAGAPSPIEVKVFGPDVNTLKDLTEEVGKRVSATKGVVDEADGIIESGPEVVVKVDPERAAQLGLSTDTITAATQGAMQGDSVGTIWKGDIVEPIRVRYPYARQRTEQMLSDLAIASPTSQLIPLTSVATISTLPGSPQLNRENERLVFSVTSRLDPNTDLGSGVKAVQKSLASLTLPPGYSIEYGGLYKSQQESFNALKTVLVVAAILVFGMLVLAFRSLRIAIALLVAAVLSLFGVLLALYITKTPLNISSYTGAIMIVGIVTENGVLLFYEFQRERNLNQEASVEELLSSAGKARLRPILMTICAAILTLFPLALGIGAGAAMQKPLAVAVIGGLTLSMFFTLVVAPVLYASLSHIRHRISPNPGNPASADSVASG
jgi:CzcA family heavy metal efflux pump